MSKAALLASAAAAAAMPAFEGAKFTIAEADVPQIAAGPGGRERSDDNAYMQTMVIMAAAVEPAKSYRFFSKAEDAPAAITNEDERKKAYNDNVRRLSNRLSGYARRLRGSLEEPGKYPRVLFKVVKENEGGVDGIAVYRVKDAEPTAAVTRQKRQKEDEAAPATPAPDTAPPAAPVMPAPPVPAA